MSRGTPGGPVPDSRTPRRIRRPGALVIDALLVLILVLLLPQTLGLDDGARRFPLITIIVMLLLLLLDAAIEVFPAVRRRARFLEEDFIDVHDEQLVEQAESSEDVAPEEGSQKERTFRVLTVWEAVAWLVSLGLAMYFLGYVASTPIFLALFFLWSRVPIKVAIGITATMSLLNYFVFFNYLGLR